MSFNIGSEWRGLLNDLIYQNDIKFGINKSAFRGELEMHL
jgi:hypothetical protein